MRENGGTCDVRTAKVHTTARNKVAVLPLYTYKFVHQPKTQDCHTKEKNSKYSCKGSTVCITFVSTNRHETNSFTK